MMFFFFFIGIVMYIKVRLFFIDVLFVIIDGWKIKEIEKGGYRFSFLFFLRFRRMIVLG